VNALSLYHDLKQRGVVLKADGERLLVDAPVGVVTEDDKNALLEVKHVLLKLLSQIALREQEGDDRRCFDARRSRHLGYTSLYDPIEGKWHDFPTKDCYPSIVALADRRSKKGGSA
jgi:TubC N-terminal docking domain